MLNHLLAGLFHGRQVVRRPAKPRRSRLIVEQLEDRTVPTALPAATGLQTQTLTNPTSDAGGNHIQFIDAGVYETVASQAVTVSASQTGLFQMSFQAQVYSGMSNRIGVRYLIDGALDPNDAVVRSGTQADAVEDVGNSGWQCVYLNRLINLAPGAHVVSVQVFCNMPPVYLTQALGVYSPTLSLVGMSTIAGLPTANGIVDQALANHATGQPGLQNITGGTWQTLTSQSVTIGTNKTGLVDLTFQAPAVSQATDRVSLRYLIDGNVDPHDAAVGSNGTGADTSEEFADGFAGGEWHTLLLMHQLVLTPGTHTITIQIKSTPLALAGGNMVVYTPVLSLLAYNIVNSQHAADGVQAQTVATAAAGLPGQQNVTAGSWQTIASMSVPASGIRSGLYDFTFQAQEVTNVANRVYVRYLIDGKPDPNDASLANSPGESDAVVDSFNNFMNDAWHTLYLTRLLSLTPGTHTISVQVWCTAQGLTAGKDLVVYTPAMHVTAYNNVNAALPPPVTTNGPFTYNPASQVLTINGKSGNDVLKFAEVTKANTDGSLTTTYTFIMDSTTVTYTNSQISQVVVNGNGGSDTANLYTNDTYVGTDGQTHETAETVNLGPGGGTLQKLDASGNPYTFLQLLHFSRINAYMGQADSAQLHGGTTKNTFSTAGLTSYMTGTGYYNYVSGAGSVTGYASTIHDLAYQYDGSGASTFTATGTTSSTMTGTDHGASFSNTAMGFHFNYGIARHAGDVANLYDGPGTDVFVGQATRSWMYSYTGTVETMYNQASGFSSVNAFATAGGKDYSYNYAPRINTVTGFKRLVG
jgi:hypothetical protein